MKHAWIEENKIRDIAPSDPAECYHPDVAKYYDTEVPDNAENGDGWVNGVLIKPEPIIVPVVPSEPVYPIVGVITFKLLFTSVERIAIKASQDPIIIDFFELTNDPRTVEVNLALKTVQDMLYYLESKKILTADRVAEILTGQVK